MFKRWEPSDQIKDLIFKFGKDSSRGIEMMWLYNRTKFWILDWDWIPFLKNIAGITLHPSFVLISKEAVETYDPQSPPSKQAWIASLVYHELIHVSQHVHFKPLIFLFLYFLQWIVCGFSYKRMRTKGFEKEAYDLQDSFYTKIRGSLR